MNADGANPVMLTDPVNSSCSYPCWSPNGKKIAFHSDFFGGNDFYTDIYIMDSDGSNVTRITDNGTDNLEPCWID